MNTNFDDIEAFVNTTPGVVQADIVDAKGDIVAASAADTVSRLAVGTDTYVLTADSGEATGLKWAAPTTGDITGVTAGTNISGGGVSGTVTVNLAVDAAVDMGTDGSGVDVTFHSASAGDYMLWDASEEKLILEGTNAATVLDVTDGNVSIGDGTLAVSGAVTVGTDGAGADVTFHSGTSGDLMLWDASDKALEFTDAKITMGDNLIETPEFIDYAESVNAIGGTGGGTQDLDIALGNVQTATVDTSTNTFTFSNPSISGKSCSFTLILTNGGSQTVNWPASVDWAGSTAPTLTTSGVDVLTFMTVDAGTTWYGFSAGLDMG
jgi:hypothetical protein